MTPENVCTARLVSHPNSIPHRIGETDTIDVVLTVKEKRRRRFKLAAVVVREFTLVSCQMKVEVRCVEASNGTAMLVGNVKTTRSSGPQDHPIMRFVFQRERKLTLVHPRDAEEVEVTFH